MNVSIEDTILKTGVPSIVTEMFLLGIKPSPSFSNFERGWVCAFIDEKGLYSDDPKKNSGAEFIPKVGVRELLKMDLDDLIIERPCLEILQNSQMIHQI